MSQSQRDVTYISDEETIILLDEVLFFEKLNDTTTLVVFKNKAETTINVAVELVREQLRAIKQQRNGVAHNV